MNTNIRRKALGAQSRVITRLFQTLAQLPRLHILQVIGEGEACVCHLEAALGYRQAYISQHLMALRKAGLVTPRRDGRNIFYRVTKLELLELIRQAAGLLGNPPETLYFSPAGKTIPSCNCPHCEATALALALAPDKIEIQPVQQINDLHR